MNISESSTLDDTYDVVVVGSGAGGLTAALTAANQGLQVIVVEKAAHYGGSTARSGGAVWVPGNRALIADGQRDEPGEARTYVRSIVDDGVSDERIDAFLDNGPAMIDLVLANTRLKLKWIEGYSDYYPEAPGGRAEGRAVEAAPFDAGKPGVDRASIEPDYSSAPMGVVVTSADYKWLNLMRVNPKGPLRILRIGGRWLTGKALRRDLVGRGQALVAGLREGLARAGVPLLLSTPMTDLVIENDSVVGVEIESDGKARTLRARHGVIITSGGFEHNEPMRTKYQRQPIGTQWTVGAAGNTGDGIRIGEAVGASLEYMDDAWWGPSIPLPRGPWFALAERSLPGSLMINDRGLRFFNESAPYVDAVHSMYGGLRGQGDGPGENVPCWLLFDQRYRDRYMFAAVYPGAKLPRRWIEGGVITIASTPGELAEKIGVPADAVIDTVNRFNAFAETGIDEDFHRGKSRYDHYYGDPRNKPNPSLAPLSKGPFYAVKMVPGDLGTKGGIRADARARALRDDYSVIDGLYAAGNSSSPVMGHTYAGPGATIGPAMTYGYIAARDIAARKEASSRAENRTV
ncbi:MAG: 3-oxosteroid 1-dehydrogenase [Rhodococcus sp. (in: high G+C Gram-positive bacteria)]